MKTIIASILSFAPTAAFAQITGQINTVDTAVTKFGVIGNTVISILITISVIWIIVHVVRYLIAGGEEERKKGGMAILWGIVGLFVILSIWGLVNILTNTFSTQRNVPVDKFPILPINQYR
jgi:hypothetical protein